MNQKSKFKDDFPRIADRIYLNTGAEGIPPASSIEALQSYMRAKSKGAEGRPELYETDRLCKRDLSRLLGVSTNEVALVGNASEALNRLRESIDWKTDDEVVIDDLEFPSNVLPWLRLRESGVRVKVLKSRNWVLSPEDFERAVTPKTRLVSVSHVSYMSGTRLDITSIGKIAHSVGAIYSVDATQSLGRIPVPMEEVDYLVSSTYKWLLAPHGGGVLFCSAALLDELNARSVGWWSVPDLFSPERFEKVELKETASRFELGMPNFLLCYGLRDSLEYLQNAGIEDFSRDLETIGDFLVEEFSRMDLAVMTPQSRQSRAGLISFLHRDCTEIAGLLAREGIYVWGGDGRIRVSVHLYNDLEEAESLVRHLQSILRKINGK